MKMTHSQVKVIHASSPGVFHVTVEGQKNIISCWKTHKTLSLEQCASCQSCKTLRRSRMDGALAADSKPAWNFSGLQVFTDFIPHPLDSSDHRSEGVWSVSVMIMMMFGQDLFGEDRRVKSDR